jgi:2-dehydro-3-deoxygalactonokinase
VIDWGTSKFRAQLLDEDGTVCDSFCSESGIGKLHREGMRDEIRRLRHLWPAANTEMLACGMVGSSLGWVEAASLPCSVGLLDIAGAITRSEIDGVQLHIVPGVRCHNPDTGWDVMRGEELQAFGWAALQSDPAEPSGLCVMPGTHSKWLRLEQGRIERFSTAMTGELFALLSERSLLRHHITADVSYGQAFERGLAAGAGQTGMARHLFSVRANSLLDELSNADAGSFVSGLLIGAEIADALHVNDWTRANEPVQIVASSPLTDLYSKALAWFDIGSTVTDCQLASAAGFLAVHREMKTTETENARESQEIS